MDIWKACEKGNIRYIKQYLDDGKNIEEKGYKGVTPIIWASWREQEEVVRLLAECGADIEHGDNEGKTAIAWASWYGYENVVRLLVELGANIESRSSEGMTPLMLASWYGNEKTVNFLVGQRANIEARDNSGATPIMHAASHGYENVVRLLARSGANIDAQDSEGWSSIMLALYWGNEHVVRTFIDLGANVNLQDNDGQTALSHALEDGQLNCAILLAPLTTPDQTVSYESIRMSRVIPRQEHVENESYLKFVKKIVPMYLSRAIKDPAFGLAMQQDVEEIMEGKTGKDRTSINNKDKKLMAKILKTLRSIDYTDRIGHENDEKTSSYVYDMEL